LVYIIIKPIQETVNTFIHLGDFWSTQNIMATKPDQGQVE